MFVAASLELNIKNTPIRYIFCSNKRTYKYATISYFVFITYMFILVISTCDFELVSAIVLGCRWVFG
jgi:hypothetical protein